MSSAPVTQRSENSSYEKQETAVSVRDNAIQFESIISILTGTPILTTESIGDLYVTSTKPKPGLFK